MACAACWAWGVLGPFWECGVGKGGGWLVAECAGSTTGDAGKWELEIAVGADDRGGTRRCGDFARMFVCVIQVCHIATGSKTLGGVKVFQFIWT